MKKLSSLLLVALLIGCGGGGGGGGDSTPNVADTYYPSIVGYSWTYNNTPPSRSPYTSKVVVISSSRSGFTIKQTNVGSGYYYGQTDYVYEGSSLKYTDAYSYLPNGSISSHTQYAPSAIVLPSNMASNTTESTTSTMTTNSGGTVTTSSVIRSITVNGEESVTTPAGTFTATKVTLTITTTPLGGTATQSSTIYWYVKNIGRVKLVSTSTPSGGVPITSTTELISYGQAPPIDTTGIWRGTYISSLFGSNTATLGLAQTNSAITGNFSSTTGALGSVSGSVSGDTLHFTITVTTPGCSGSFAGTGIVSVPVSGPMTMGFNYSGSSTCGGAESGTGMLTISTPFAAPTVITHAATSVGANTATLNGNVTANGLATNAWFEYGTDSSLASPSSTSTQAVGSGTTSQPVNAALTGLTTGTTYYYRVAASNSSGTIKGSILSFTTIPSGSPGSFEVTFNFSGGFHIYGNPPNPQIDGFDYYFSPVQTDISLSGKKVKINSVIVSFPALSTGDVVNWDWEIYIGATSFGLPTGQFIKTIIDPVSGYTKNAPIKILFAEGAYNAPNPTNYIFNATYDFNTGTLSGTPTPRSLTQAVRSDILLTNGLYAQMFFWAADNRNCYISFGAGTLTVKGEIIP